MNNELRDKDINLLRIFLVIAEELNLTRASARLSLSQPALSHALRRLRSEFNDPLFVRGSRGLSRTQKVIELLPQVQNILQLCENLYRQESPSDFKKLRRNLVLGATTYFEIRVLDHLISDLQAESPLSTLETRSLLGEIPKEALESGAMDLAVAAYFADVPENFWVRHLGCDPFKVLVRPKHPYLKSKRRVEDYLQFRHLKIDIPPGAVAYIDRALADSGKRREIAVNVGNFMTPPQVVANSDLILTCPQSLANRYAKMQKLEVLDPPLKLDPLEVRMIWHERTHHDPFQKWFRDRVAEAAKNS